MISRSAFAILICGLLVCFANAAHGQAADFYLKNNDRVLFYGDSITEQSFYTNYVETYVLTRFPKLRVTFVNSGWSGDKVWGGGGGNMTERLQRDVYPFQPTVVTAMFGMNDGCYIEFNADCYRAFTENYEKLIDKFRRDLPSARLTLFRSSPFDDWTDSGDWRLAPPVKSGYNEVLIRYGKFVGELAAKNNLTSVDLNAPLAETIQRAQKINRDAAQKIIPDRIHPSNAGGLLMAQAILKAWNAAPLVSKIVIDAQSKKLVSSEKTIVSALKVGGKVSWTQLDESLPLPIDLNDQTIKFVAGLSNINESLNDEKLVVLNLNAGRYQLKIDDQEIAVFTREELEKGVNLANFQTPMMKQSFAVHRLTERHNRIHFVRWREIQVPYEKENSPDLTKTLNALDVMKMNLVKIQRQTAQPKARVYELISVN